jgi:hypothetical protein
MTMSSITHIQYSGSAPVEPSAGGVATPTASILPDPLDQLATSGDAGAELAALAVKSGQNDRKVTQALRDNYETMEANQDRMEVDAMRKKAEDIRTGGVVEGLGTMAEGGLGIAMAPCTSTNGSLTAAGNGFKAGATVVHGGTAIVTALYKANEAGDDADAAMHRAAADQAKSAAEDMHDAKKSAGEDISAAIDFFREYSSAKASERNAALRRA